MTNRIARRIGIALAAAWIGAGILGCGAEPAAREEALDVSPAVDFRKTGTPYLGMSLRDEPDERGAVVGWVLPGPLRPGGEKTAMARRGDILALVDGRRLKSMELKAYVKTKRPGDVIELKLIHTSGDVEAAIATPGKESKEETLKVVLGAKEEWCGPVEFSGNGTQATRPASHDATIRPGPRDPMIGFIDRRIDENGLREPVDKLTALFDTTAKEIGGYNILPVVRDSYGHQDRLLDNEIRIAGSLKAAATDPMWVIPWAAAWRGDADLGSPPTPTKAFDLSDPQRALATLARDVEASNQLINQAFAAYPGRQRKVLRNQLDLLMKVSQSAGEIEDETDPRPAIAAMRASMKVRFDKLFGAATAVSGFMIKSAAPPKDAKPVPLPPELSGAVTGEILGTLKVADQWFVYGGFGPNTYDMSRIAAVIDPGGGDTFNYPDKPLPTTQVVVDMGSGNTYLGDGAGPAAGIMGVSLIVDYGGDSAFKGKSMACGVGYMGVGIIVCHDGDNTFEGESWSQGAGFYGLGAILNLSGKRHEYRAQSYSQGIGGPGGVGVIFDHGSHNLYFTDGPVGSAYGMQGARFSMSQGVGFGVRGYDSGGLGVIYNGGDQARYIAGEFCQGGGYYWGLGIIHNVGPDSLFYSNRYSQGFGCHQALGVVDCESGRDTFWATVAASQGAAWDIAAGLLIDRGGHNSYRSDGISMGSGAMQGIGWMINLGPSNQFRSTGMSAQGQSAGNAYHYERTGCQSWSLFLDAQGDQSQYFDGRMNGKTIVTGAKNEKKPQDSTLHGLFISVPGKVDWNK